ncbi:MAG TPA: Calx-beta domain-containing protein, partial [Pyrinomonadaceae bacterium]|nr:Calx-beta domain-containing protein [Pyrinomonadaceae bacterium]
GAYHTQFTVAAASSAGLPIAYSSSGSCTNVGATFTITASAGTCTVKYDQAGDPNFNAAAQVTETVTARKAAQAITFDALPDKTFGDADFTLSATASSGLAVGFAASGQCTVTGTTVHLTGAGSCTITASQSGDPDTDGETNVSQSFQIARAATTVALSASQNPSMPGQSVTFTAQVSSAVGKPTGNVQFKDGTGNLGSPVNLDAGGAATFTTSTLTAGTHAITTDYSGDANFASSAGTLPGGQAVNDLPSLSINDLSIAEGNSGTTNATLTVTLSSASSLVVKVDFATADGTATAGSDYQASSGTLTFNPGETQKSITVSVSGDTATEPDETFFINLSQPVNCAISKAQGRGTITNDDSSADTLQFGQADYSVAEDAGSLQVTVTRTSDSSGAASIDYATSDNIGLTTCNVATGLASQRCDYTMALGTLTFAAGETSKTITILVDDDSYVEGNESFTLKLTNPVGTTLGATSTATVTIIDNDLTEGRNPIDSADFFIRQHYHDFLNREPEPPGLEGWLNVLNTCPQSGRDANGLFCDRVEVSSDFYRSPEFQARAYFLYRFYSVALGRIPHYQEFMMDLSRTTGFLTDQQVEAGRAAFISEFMSRQEFKSRYDSTISDPIGYVNALEQTAKVTLANKQALIDDLAQGRKTRAEVLRMIVESQEVAGKFFNEAFVVEEYFGYLRRDPDIHYLEWVDTLNRTGDYRVMVNGFANSAEYRQRFGR